MSMLQEFGKVVVFSVMFVSLLCDCSDRLLQWGHYQEGIRNKWLFDDMHWPNEEWVMVISLAFLKFVPLLYLLSTSQALDSQTLTVNNFIAFLVNTPFLVIWALKKKISISARRYLADVCHFVASNACCCSFDVVPIE